MPRIGSFGPSLQIKDKFEWNHVIRVAINKHVFGETKFTYLRVTSMCSQYIVAVNSKLGRVKDKESSYLGNNCFLFRIIFGSKNKHWTKSGQKLGPAENWAQYWILYSPPSPMAMGTHSYSNVLVSWGLDRNTEMGKSRWTGYHLSRSWVFITRHYKSIKIDHRKANR